MHTRARRYGCEFLGTLVLVFFGVGTAIAASRDGGMLVVSLAFGFILLALVYTIGPVSGCHVNPAVTLGATLARRLPVRDAIGYLVAQVAGATVAAFLLWAMTQWGEVRDQTGTLGTNRYGENINFGGAVLLEVVLTFLLVLVALVTNSRTEHPGFAGLAIGATLTACTLTGIQLDGASLNPARSLGPALFAGGMALSQVWVFLVFPLVGGLLAALVLPLVEPPEQDDAASVSGGRRGGPATRRHG